MTAFATTRFLDLLDAEMRRLVGTALASSPASAQLARFYDMAGYHLGWNSAGGVASAGKRLRPLLIGRVAEALGVPIAHVLPAAAAVEFLHNFTLVHDDIQDQSAFRRHRETVWQRWGTAQAINVGDALYAIAHDALVSLADPPVRAAPKDVLALLRDFDRTALRIVEGQYLDLAYEGAWHGDEALYLATIRGKTAELIAFCARAGAHLAGAAPPVESALSRFGLALGLAFQIKDDLLGIWGLASVTGKPAADDLRRRKQTLPLVLLDARADAATRAELREIYTAAELDADAIARVLDMLNRFDVKPACTRVAQRYYDEAHAAIESLGLEPARSAELYQFLDALESRDS